MGRQRGRERKRKRLKCLFDFWAKCFVGDFMISKNTHTANFLRADRLAERNRYESHTGKFYI